MDIICAVQLLGNKPGERIGMVKFYEAGYYPAAIQDNPEWTAEEVKRAVIERNLELGVPQDVAESAALASMFGWHTPAAEKAIQFFKQQSQAAGQTREWPHKAPADLTSEQREQVAGNLADVNAEAKHNLREAEARVAEYKRIGKLR